MHKEVYVINIMDSLHITSCLKRNKYTQKIFRGVFPIDYLPLKDIKRPGLIIVNTAISTHPGKHWVAIYLPKSNRPIEFFDSYGRLLQNRYFDRFFTKFVRNNKILFNNRILQSSWTAVCGYYCCVYAVFRGRGISMNKFISIFSEETPENDRKIVELFHKHFKYPRRK